MGTILHIATKKKVVLGAYSVVGRGSTNLVQLTDARTSTVHASISWNGERWEVHDFASTNGTWVNDERVLDKARVALSRGSVVRFGTDAEQWQLVDDRGPVVVARCLTTGEIRAAESGLLELPDDDDAQVSIVVETDERWFVVQNEDGTQYRAVHDALITTENRTWQLEVPPDAPNNGTYKAKPQPSLSTMTLRFRLSLEKNHVYVDILHDNETIELGERLLFATLLKLAEKRIEDEKAAKLPESERGWYDLPDLVFDLKAADEQIVNTNIHRLKQLFVRKGVEGGLGIIEKRLKQRRITISRLEIDAPGSPAQA